MNNFKMVFLVLTLALVLMTGKEAAADCPAGFTAATKYVTVNGCQYQVDICYQCNVASPSIIRIENFKKVDPNCYQSWNEEQVYSDIRSKLTSGDSLRVLCGMPGPCGDGKFWTARSVLCWNKTLLNGTIVYNPCEPLVYCEVYFELCWDTETQKFIKRYYQPSAIFGSFYCLTPYYAVQDPVQENQPSTCFYIISNCTTW